MSIPALGVLFATGAGTAAAGAGWSILGSVIGGVATGWMKSKEEKEAERREIAEEDRRKANNKGLGASLTDYYGVGDDEVGSIAEEVNNAPTVGTVKPDEIGQRVDRVGLRADAAQPQTSRIRKRIDAVNKPKPRYNYNPRSGQIEFA